MNKYIVITRDEDEIIICDSISGAEKEMRQLISDGWPIADIKVFDARQLNFDIKINIDTISA
jgi:hypothetical protein